MDQSLEDEKMKPVALWGKTSEGPEALRENVWCTLRTRGDAAGLRGWEGDQWEMGSEWQGR